MDNSLIDRRMSKRSDNVKLISDFDVENTPVQLQHNACNS